jgi:Calcineurin-like phosphoesterase
LDWFYTETLKLDVPVFMVPGNHDGWARYDQSGANLEEDYLHSWRRLFGPQYFSFDYGPDSHFTAINSMDWTPAERSLHWALPMMLLGPHQWQGQVTGGGDPFETGWTKERENAVDENDFAGQLLWVKKDLEAHASAKTKTLLLHHDPWKTEGSGSMFEHMAVIPDLLPWGGRGTGRLSLIKLARENNVALVLSGHDHSDAYGSVEWEDGSGEVKFANTTSTQFQDGDRQNRWEYPGYRFVRVKDGEVENCYYRLATDASGAPMHYSWPFYAGTSVGGPNDLEALVDPAIETAWSPRPGRAQNIACTITNRLTGFEITPGGAWSGDLERAVVEFPMPVLSGGHYYTVTNGTIVEVFDSEAGDRRTYVVTTDVSHATSEDEPSTKTVKISKSATPDTEAPTCTTFQIEDGAATTGEALVTLTNDAVDLGGSGLQDMKIWNDGESEAAAKWRRYDIRTSWELRHEAGVRTVNVRFRDGAMPANESDLYTATITLAGSAPTISSITPGAAHVGDRVVIDGAGFADRRTRADRVLFNGIAADVMSWGDTRITCSVPYGVCTSEVSVFTDAGSASSEFHVMPSVDMVVPDHIYDTGVIHIDNLEGTGFFAGGKSPAVKLTNGPVSIPAMNVVVVSPQSITCDFDITGAKVGYYSVVVENEDGYDDSLLGGLVADYPPPSVTGLTPDSGLNTGAVDVNDLAGDNFLEGMRAWLTMGRAEIEAAAVVVASPGSATCTFDITRARAGKWRVRVQNKDGKEGTLSRAFTIK